MNHPKLLTSALLATATLAASLLAAPAAQAAPTFVFAENGSAYYLTERAGTWTQAEAEAVAMGGHLVTINDAAEQAALNLANHFGTSQRLWIGLNDAASEGVFAWISGEVSAFTFWTAGEPNNWAGIEDYAMMNWLGNDGRWNDLPEGGYGAVLTNLSGAFGIIEVKTQNVPEPGALGLVGLGLGLLAWRRRAAA